MQVPWPLGEHQEAPTPCAENGQIRPPSQPAASNDLFFAKSSGTSATKSPVRSPAGDIAVSSQQRQHILFPAIANSMLQAEHVHSSPRHLPAIQEVEVEEMPQDGGNPTLGADGGADKRPYPLQALGDRLGAPRELVRSHKEMGVDACCQPVRATAAAPKCPEHPAPAHNRHAAGSKDEEGAAAKEKGATRKARGRAAGRPACKSPPSKPRQKASAKVRCALHGLDFACRYQHPCCYMVALNIVTDSMQLAK